MSRIRLQCLLFALGGLAALAAADLPTPLIEALEALRKGSPSPGQRALLFQNNDLINAARLNGWIPDAHYQAAQTDFADINQHFAKQAAANSGADFTSQARRGGGFQPGTDSDYIVKTKGPDPVGQIKKIQANYDELVNKWLKTKLEGEGMRHTPKAGWSKRLDVDFMADPANVTKAQFEQIKDLNNSAYKRQEAAEYERISRLQNGGPVSDAQIKGYADEMLEQIAKKQDQMAKYRSNPGLLNDPIERANYVKMMAQEQKYIQRLEEIAERLRSQEGITPPKPFRPPEVKATLKNGEWVFETRSNSVAEKGALRGPGNVMANVTGSVLSPNSTRRALQNLADALSEARTKNPGKFPSAAKDIASLASKLPASEKGALIESIIRRETRGGKSFAKEVAIEMRKEAGGKTPAPGTTGPLGQLDSALQSIFKINNNLSEMGQMRRTVNEMAGKVLGGLSKLQALGNLLLAKDVLTNGYEFATQLARATDPNTTDAEANKAFEKAQAAANNLAMTGGMGVLFGKVPTLGAMYASYRVGYDGSRWLLENTETGKMIDRTALEFFDKGTQAGEIAYDAVLEAFGGESQGMKDQDQQIKLEKSYLDAIKAGRMKLKPGFTTKQLIDALRAGKKGLADTMILNTTNPNVKDDGRGYMAWTNEVGWIHCGTVAQFRAIQARGSEIWGGLSNEPMRKVEFMGGKTFDTLDDAMKALAAQIGGSIEKRFAPLASPRQYYVAGDKMVGFDIVRHPLFKSYIEAADKKAAGGG